MEFLNNPWITGIGGGIISGLIVYFITSQILSRKQDREYSQKVTTANNELLYTMRPLVVQKQIPSKWIMESIILSIARKHGVNKGDLFNILLLVDDLIREVMENAFLDSEQKMEFCEKIYELTHEDKKPEEVVRIFEKIGDQNNRLSSQYVSTLLAITASMMVLIVSLFTTMKDGFKLDGFDNLSSVSTITLIGVIVPTFTMIMSLLLKRMKKYEQDKMDDRKHKAEKGNK